MSINDNPNANLTLKHGLTLTLTLSLITLLGRLHPSMYILEIGRLLGHYGDHPHPQVADRGTPSRMDKRVAPDKEGAADKQCLEKGKL